MRMFEEMADEIFTKAGVSKDKNEHIWDEVVLILGDQMATLSATMGLSYERVKVFEEQKQALIQDLIAGKASGDVK